MVSTVPTTPGAIWAASDRAYTDQAPFDHVLEQIYELILPYRHFEKAKGHSKMDKVFDSTAVRSAFRFAGRLQMDLIPPFQQWFELRPGPAAKAQLSESQLQTRRRQLEGVSKLVFAALDISTFHTAANEMCQDLVAGQGALLVTEGPDEDPLRFEAVPSDQIALKDGPDGRAWQVHYRKTMTLEDVANTWPERVTTPKALSEALAKSDDKARQSALRSTLQVLQATVWNPADKRWVLSVIVPDETGHILIHEQKTRTCPWITPRFFKVPGESRGRGPAWLALPDVRVANKTVELTLRAAALAILGLWTRTPSMDGSGQLNMGRLPPGSVITVARNAGGIGGASIAPLDIPRNFDVSNLLLNEYREQIRETLFDRAIPRSNGTPRSASEIIEGIRLYAEDLAAAFGRLVTEIVQPLIRRVIEILYNKSLLGENVQIDQLMNEVKVTSSLANAQNLIKVRAITQWLEVISAVMPAELVMLSAKLEEVGAEIGQLLGVPEKLMRTTKEGEELQKIVAEILANQQMAAQAQQQQAQPA